MPTRQPPIADLLPAVVAALRDAPTVVVHAPTGAGKTTALPPALLDAGLAGDGAVWVLEPRRVAARAAARFVARARGAAPGGEVGWHVRFEPRFSEATRLLYLTTGVAVRRLSDDPFLDGVGVVVVDELHERALDLDLAVALLRRIQAEVRPDLRLVLMSATLDAARLAASLGDAPILRSEGRAFPVDVRYLPHPSDEREPTAGARAIRRALATEPGDILAFFSGTGEIRAAAEALDALPDVDILPLHGSLTPEAQDRALVPGPRRRVVLATNVAETSLTIDGIRVVVDTGTARLARTDPASGLDRLVVEPISRAAADQRAGRAGRTAPGVALRLWTEREHHGRPAFDEPEIRRADLAAVVLQLRAWGEADPAALPWIEPPPAVAVDAADALLGLLGLRDARGLTALGRRAAALPLHPRIAVLLLYATDAGFASTGALAAAILSGRDPRRRHDPTLDPPTPTTDCDLYERVVAVRAGRGPGLSAAAAREAVRVARQLERLLPRATTGSARRSEVGRGVDVAASDAPSRRPDTADRRGQPDPSTGPDYSSNATSHRVDAADRSGPPDPSTAPDPSSAPASRHPDAADRTTPGDPSTGPHPSSAPASRRVDAADRTSPPDPSTGPDHRSARTSPADRGPRTRPAIDPADHRNAPARDTAKGVPSEATILRQAAFAAWPDRLARRRAPGSERALLRSGRGVRVTPGSGVREAELFTALVLDDGPRREGLVRLASAVDRSWVRPTEVEQVRFDPDKRLVVARAEERLDAIILSERPLPAPDPALALDALLGAIRADPTLLPLDAPEVDALRARLALLAARCPELGLPDPDDAWLDAALPGVLDGRRGLDGLDGPALAEALLATLSWSARRDLDAHAPVHLPIPSGRSARLTWSMGARPILAVRMQELFGLRDTPRVARGREPVLLHLLAPNGRPAQITDDLESFWRSTWHEVRRDLRARYPKHDWPEDPYTATPSERPRRRRP